MGQRPLKPHPFTVDRQLHEVVEVTKDCELGEKGERAVVVYVGEEFMTLVFPNRAIKHTRKINTGADYTHLRRA